MLQNFAIAISGIWIFGGLVLALLSWKTRAVGVGAMIGGLLGLAICLSY